MPKVKAKKEKNQPGAKAVQTLRGFKDILPAEQPYWSYIRKLAESFAKGYRFSVIEPPILEEAGLFSRAIGKPTGIAEKEKFSFFNQT